MLRYFLYRQLQAEPKASPSHWFVPVLAASMLLSLNVFTFAVIGAEILGTSVPVLTNRRSAGTALIGCTVLVCLLTYLGLIRTGRYQELIKKFSSESAQQRRLRTRLMYAYQLLSYLAPAIVGVVVHARH